MTNWLKLIDWQTYQYYRFRKARNTLYPGDLRQLRFPASPLHGSSSELFSSPGIDQQFLKSGQGNAWDGGIKIDAGIDSSSKSYAIHNFAAWALGELPPQEKQEDWAFYWMQAGALFNIARVTPAGADHLFLNILATSQGKASVLADFCLDNNLSSWAAFLENRSTSHDSQEILARLGKYIAGRGNVVISAEKRCQIPSSPWIPTVYIRAAEGNQFQDLPGDEVPPQALKVLLSFSTETLPGSVHPDWDLCLALGNGAADSPLTAPWQGWIISESIPALVKLIDMRVHAKSFQAIACSSESLKPAEQKISVVISTYHRPAALSAALQSVIEQTLPLQDYELIVVNNDPWDPSILEVIERFRTALPPAHKIRLRNLDCPLPGLSYARNMGIGAAQGEVICFLDDDAQAHPRWLEQLWLAYQNHPQAGVIGGPIHLRAPLPRPKVLKQGLDRFWGHFQPPYEEYTEVQQDMQFPWGGNWSIRRKAMHEIGGFRVQYGRRQNDFSGGEELIAGILCQRLGYTIGIMPTAAVDHQPEPNRFTFGYLFKTIQAQIIIRYRMSRDQYLTGGVTVAKQVKGVGRFTGRVLKLLRMPAAQRESLAIEYVGYILAWSRLFIHQMRDLWERFWFRFSPPA